MKAYHILSLMLLAGFASACGSAPPAQQANTVPLRSGQQIATEVGEKTREVQAKNKDMVLYATSIEQSEAPAKVKIAADMGGITVYSKPRGEIVLDGEKTGIRTPNTMEAAPGRHEIQVLFEDGETSDVKIVRSRGGSRIKLFFRSGAAKKGAPSSTETSEPEVTPPELTAGMGGVAVYSKPRGEIVLDGKKTGIRTPSLIEATPGKHEIQVLFDDGEMSGTKVVDLSEGVRVKLFLRDEAGQTSEDNTEPESTPPSPKKAP